MGEVFAERFITADYREQEQDNSHWLRDNVVNPALNAGPLAVYNIAADFGHLPEVHLKTAEAKPYSANWYVQGVASGVGAAVPFMLATAGAGYAMRATEGALGVTAVGRALAPVLTSERAAAVVGATLFGALQKPEEGHTRFGNAVGMGAGFMVFSGGNMLSREMPFLGKALTYPLTGLAGGATMSEVSSLFSSGKLAPSDQVLQSAVQGAALNTVLPLANEGTRYLSEKFNGNKPPSPGQSAEAALKDSARQQAAASASLSTEAVVLREAAAKSGMTEVKPAGSGQSQAGDGTAPKAAIPLSEASERIGAATSKMHGIAQLSREYGEWVRKNTPRYPSQEEFAKLTPEQIVERGFYHPDAKNLDMLESFKDKGPRPLPDAKVVASEVTKSVSGMPLAKPTGNLILGEWNMEFLTGDKARYFADTYKQVIPRHHLLFVEEVNKEGLAQIAKDNGYNYAISAENSRGQAVGMLVNPRLKVLGTHAYTEVADVHNIPDLRPAFRVDLQDVATGNKLAAVVVHLKSMRGGPAETSAVRTQQSAILAKVLEPNFSGVIAGDWNTFLDNTHDLDPLKTAGFQTLNPADHTSTQSITGSYRSFP